MRVWILTVGDYADAAITGVYATAALAEAEAVSLVRQETGDQAVELTWNQPYADKDYRCVRSPIGSMVIESHEVVGLQGGE